MWSEQQPGASSCRSHDAVYSLGKAFGSTATHPAIDLAVPLDAQLQRGQNPEHTAPAIAPGGPNFVKKVVASEPRCLWAISRLWLDHTGMSSGGDRAIDAKPSEVIRKGTVKWFDSVKVPHPQLVVCHRPALSGDAGQPRAAFWLLWVGLLSSSPALFGAPPSPGPACITPGWCNARLWVADIALCAGVRFYPPRPRVRAPRRVCAPKPDQEREMAAAFAPRCAPPARGLLRK